MTRLQAVGLGALLALALLAMNVVFAGIVVAVKFRDRNNNKEKKQ